MTRGESDNESQVNADSVAVPEASTSTASPSTASPSTASTSTASTSTASASEGVGFVDANDMPDIPIRRPVGRAASSQGVNPMPVTPVRPAGRGTSHEGVRFVDANAVPATPIRPVGRKRGGDETLASIADFLAKKQQRTEDASTLSTSSRVFGIYIATELDEIKCSIARRRARSAIQDILYQANMAQDLD